MTTNTSTLVQRLVDEHEKKEFAQIKCSDISQILVLCEYKKYTSTN